MTADEIWRLISTGDNFLKLGSSPRAVERARSRFERALEAAERAGLPALAGQARRRLEDLARMGANPPT